MIKNKSITVTLSRSEFSRVTQALMIRALSLQGYAVEANVAPASAEIYERMADEAFALCKRLCADKVTQLEKQ